jgi:DNA-directed RNA polymerase specialized sigma24 family protein
MNGSPKESKKSAAERLAEWRQAIRKDYEKAITIVRFRDNLTEAEAIDCLHNAILRLLHQWRKKGPPDDVQSWPSYLAHSAHHEHLRRPTKDARLLVFRPPVGDERNPIALDTPAVQPASDERIIRREMIRKVWPELVKLPMKQAGAFLLWAIGRTFSEIASILKVAEGRARVLKHNAVKMLREKCGGFHFPGYEDASGSPR